MTEVNKFCWDDSFFPEFGRGTSVPKVTRNLSSVAAELLNTARALVARSALAALAVATLATARGAVAYMADREGGPTRLRTIKLATIRPAPTAFRTLGLPLKWEVSQT